MDPVTLAIAGVALLVVFAKRSSSPAATAPADAPPPPSAIGPAYQAGRDPGVAGTIAKAAGAVSVAAGIAGKIGALANALTPASDAAAGVTDAAAAGAGDAATAGGVGAGATAGLVAGGAVVTAYGAKQTIDALGLPGGIAALAAGGLVVTGTAALLGAGRDALGLIGIGAGRPPPPPVGQVPSGAMVRRDSGDTAEIFLVDLAGGKHHILSSDIVGALGGDVVVMFASVVDAMPTGVDVSTTAQGQAIRAPTFTRVAPGTMIRRDAGDTSSIYQVAPDGSKQHITSFDLVQARGGTGAVVTMSAAVVDSMPTGPDLSPAPPPPPPPAPVVVVSAVDAPLAAAPAPLSSPGASRLAF